MSITQQPNSSRQMREGKIALTFRIIVGVFVTVAALVSHGPIIGLPFNIVFNLVLYELLATIPIWLCKSIQRGFAKHE